MWKLFLGEDDGERPLLARPLFILIAGGQRPPLQGTNVAGALWGGVSETHLHPIYMGMILLSGLIVACTCLVLDSIDELKNDSKRSSS